MEEVIDYDGVDSGVEWYGDVKEVNEVLLDNEEGEWLNEELETFSDDEMREGLRPDGYEEDGFVSQDDNIYFKKKRKIEDRYPIVPSRGRGSGDIKPITLRLPKCVHYMDVDVTEEVDFHQFIKSCAGLIPFSNSLILSKSSRRTPPASITSWVRKLLKKKRKRSDDDDTCMLKSRNLALKNNPNKKKKKSKK